MAGMGAGTLRSSGGSVIPKPWGYEYCAFDNGEAAVWILHIARGRGTSKHCHPNKKTQLVCLTGEVQFNGRTLRPLERVVVEKGEYHQTSVLGCETASLNGAFVMEIEEPSNKTDILRWEDSYGRADKPIEMDGVPCSVPTLELCRKAKSMMGYTFKMECTLGGPIPDLMIPLGGEVLGIYKEEKQRVSDYVAEFVKSQGVRHVFGVSGGGSMHLNDSFRGMFIPMHHEQSASMAAEAYGRLNGLGCALVTTGPGGTNAVTGVNCAWVDSVPVLYISGQVTRNTLLPGTNLRQRGVQETDIISIVEPITKYAVCVTNERDIQRIMHKAVQVTKSGRPGPVWVDIPLDVQSKLV